MLIATLLFFLFFLHADHVFAGAPCASVFKTTEPASLPEWAYVSQLFGGPNVCSVTSLPYPLITAPSNIAVYDIVMDVIKISPSSWVVGGVNVPSSDIHFTFRILTPSAITYSNLALTYSIYDLSNQGPSCGDALIHTGTFNGIDVNAPPVCDVACPYGQTCATFDAHIDFITATSFFGNGPSQIVFTFSDQNVPSLLNNYGLFQVLVGDGVLDIDVPLVTGCDFQLPKVTFYTDPCAGPSQSLSIEPGECSNEYMNQVYPYVDNTVLQNINTSSGSVECTYQRQVGLETTSLFGPFVGVTIPIPNNTFVFNVVVDFFAYFDAAHVNHYLEIVTLNSSYYNNPYNDLPYLMMPKAFYSTSCEDQQPVCVYNTAPERRAGPVPPPGPPPHPDREYSDCRFNEYIDLSEFDSSYTLSDACPDLNNYYLSSFPSSPTHITTAPPGLFEVIPGIPAAAIGKATLAVGTSIPPSIVNDGTAVFLNIAWSDVFPNDAFFIRNITYVLCQIADPLLCENFVIESKPCTGPNSTDAPCECPDCEKTSQSNMADKKFRYTTSPVMFDQDQDPIKRIKVESTPVDKRLTLFIKDAEVLLPNNLTEDFDYVTNVMTDNNCGVFISVDECSNNLQVWLQPNGTRSYQTFPQPSTINAFSCYVLQNAYTQPVFPLTDNVFVTPPIDWIFIPSGPSPSPTQKLVKIDILTAIDTVDPELKFSQGIYGFEIPVPRESPLDGIYFYCEINVDLNLAPLKRISGQFTPLFDGRNFCTASDPVALNTSGPYYNPSYPNVGVSNASLFDYRGEQSRFHYLASGECPGFSLCPENGWFINQDYGIDTDYIGLKLQFPAADLNYNNVSGIIPYEADITFKMDQPEIVDLINRFNASEDFLALIIVMEGAFESFNFLDFDLHLSTGGCASQIFPQCQYLQNSTYGTPFSFTDNLWPGAASLLGVRRVLGQGVILEDFRDPTLSVLDPYFFDPPLFGPCLLAIMDAGYTLDQLYFHLNVKVDPLTLAENPDYLFGADYNNGYQVLTRDGLAKRFYLYAGGMILLTPQDFMNIHAPGAFFPKKDQYVIYRPSPFCKRKPYTLLDYCDGPCSELFDSGLLSLADNITAKAENHPNSTMYDDLRMNSTNINAFLLSVNYTYNESAINHERYEPDYYAEFFVEDYDLAEETLDADACAYYTMLLAHDIAINGTGYAAKLIPFNISLSDNATHIAILVSFKTDILLDILNSFAVSIAPPFFPGIFIEYDNITQTVHVFGTAIGLAVILDKNDNAVATPPCPGRDCEVNPQLMYVFMDLLIPNVTRDFINVDADFISHATQFLPGPYFSQGLSPFINSNPFNYTYSDEPFTMRVTSACLFNGMTINPLQSDTNSWMNTFLYTQSRNTVAREEVDIPYQQLKGADPNITFRMGDGIDESGILGALPVVASVYSLGYMTIGFMGYVFYAEDNIIGNTTRGSERFRFAMFPCFTDCPNNATHVLRNHPGFAAYEYISPDVTPLVNNATSDTDVFNFMPEPWTLPEYSAQNLANILGPNGNMLGGFAYGFQIADGRRRISVRTYIIVMNLDTELIIQMFDVIGAGNVKSVILDPLGITEDELGLFMNLRNTLGAMNLFGVVAGTLFELNTTSNYYDPYAIVVETFGDHAGNPDINFFPIYRVPDDNDLYLGVCDPLDTSEACLVTGQLRPYLLSNTPIDVNTPAFEEATNMEFNNLADDFFNLGDLANGQGYDGVDQNVVSGWGVFRTDKYIPPLKKRGLPGPDPINQGGFKFVCVSCWFVFDDAYYFNWGESCDQFDICGIDDKTGLIQCIDRNPQEYDAGAGLNLTLYNDVRNNTEFVWINQYLTPSVQTMIIITLYTTTSNCEVFGIVNAVNFGNILLYANTPVNIITTSNFDGNNIPIDLIFNQTGCGPIISHVQLNYTHPVNCVERTMSQSQPQTQAPIYSQSSSPSPKRDYCCTPDYPMETYANPYEPPRSASRSPSQALLLEDRKRRANDVNKYTSPTLHESAKKHPPHPHEKLVDLGAKLKEKHDEILTELPKENEMLRRRTDLCCETTWYGCRPDYNGPQICDVSSCSIGLAACLDLNPYLGPPAIACLSEPCVCCDPDGSSCNELSYLCPSCSCSGFCEPQQAVNCPANDDCYCCDPNGSQCAAQNLDSNQFPLCDCSGLCNQQTYSQSESESPSPSESESESISSTYAKTTINVCDPRQAPKTILPGNTYQVRDEFVPFTSPFGPLYERMGLRVGALWLEFTGPGASVHLEYTPGKGHVTLYGWAIGIWSVPPNRVAMTDGNDLFADSLYYFEMNYTVGMIHTGGLVRQPYGPGGVPFVVQELNSTSGLPQQVLVGANNKGYITKVGHPTFTTVINSHDLEQGIYGGAGLDGLIDEFGFVQMLILSGMGTGLGMDGWFGIGEIAAYNCDHNDYGTNYGNDYNTASSDLFSELICLESFEYPVDGPRQHTYGKGFFMFVIEGTCENDCPQSHTPGVWCPIHQTSHSHSHSETASHSTSYSETTSLSGSSTLSETASVSASLSGSSSVSSSQSKKHDNEDSDHDFPLWAIIVICVGGPLLLFGCFFLILLARRRKRNNKNNNNVNSEGNQPLLEEVTPTSSKQQQQQHHQSTTRVKTPSDSHEYYYKPPPKKRD